MSCVQLFSVLRRAVPKSSLLSSSFLPRQSVRSIMDGGITKDGLFAANNTVAPKQSSILSLFSLKGRTAVISGGPAGIGLAVAKTYAEAGANIAIWYNSNAVAHERAAEIEKEYGVSCE